MADKILGAVNFGDHFHILILLVAFMKGELQGGLIEPGCIFLRQQTLACDVIKNK